MSDKTGFDLWLERVNKEHEEILRSLDSSFDEEGISLWDKWGKEAQSHIDKNNNDSIE